MTGHKHIQDGFRYSYNGMCEVMQRQLIILNTFKRHDLSFLELSHLDFFVQHGGDVGMPVSLHYPNPNRGHSYYVRIDMIDNALTLLSSCGAIQRSNDENVYRLERDLHLASNNFSSGYLKGICYASEYLEESFSKSRDDTFSHLQDRLAQLQTELANPPDTISGRFKFLKTQYAVTQTVSKSIHDR